MAESNGSDGVLFCVLLQRGAEPNLTREVGAERIRQALLRAASGVLFCDIADERLWQFQEDGWVKTFMLRKCLRVGHKSMQHFKSLHGDSIEEDGTGRMRWREPITAE